MKRIRQILPYPEIFQARLKRIISEMREKTFLDSWRGVFGTTKYNEEDVKKVLKRLGKCLT